MYFASNRLVSYLYDEHGKSGRNVYDEDYCFLSLVVHGVKNIHFSSWVFVQADVPCCLLKDTLASIPRPDDLPWDGFTPYHSNLVGKSELLLPTVPSQKHPLSQGAGC